MKINVAGVLIDSISKNQAIESIGGLLSDGGRHYLVTPYSEQIVFALRDEEYKQVLNRADLVLPDGIGILWASKFLSGRRRNSVSEFFYWLLTLFAIIFNPKSVRTVIKEQVTGRILVYDIASLAQSRGYSLALAGGLGNVAAQASYELKKLYPNLKINLALSGRPFDEKIVKEISESNSDILLLAYSPPKQEKWIAQNLADLNVKLAVGLGGTFDYLAKAKRPAPYFLHIMGLEWLWRLVAEPSRARRMWNAVPVFAFKILKYKLHEQRS
jgi:N-acetylglucosaminyldiphosphoundecaprenol N-acetyl-beta-D-mannosaminyltransferase